MVNILNFLVTNKEVINNLEGENTPHNGFIFHRPVDDNSPRYMTMFPLTEELYLSLINVVGEDIWHSSRMID